MHGPVVGRVTGLMRNVTQKVSGIIFRVFFWRLYFHLLLFSRVDSVITKHETKPSKQIHNQKVWNESNILISLMCSMRTVFPANIYLFKVINRKTRKRFEIFHTFFWKLKIKTPERCQWRRSIVFLIDFEYILYLFLVFLLVTFSKKMLAVILVSSY